MDGVGVAEQVVEIAEDLLVGTDKKRPEVVGLVLQGVEREGAFDVAAVDELVDLPVGIARHVTEHGLPGRAAR